MNRRPTSEEPLEVVRPGFVLVGRNGYSWVEGFYGDRDQDPISGLFLEAKEGGEKIVPVSKEAYLDFAALGESRDAWLDFAAVHGELGVQATHYHNSLQDLDSSISAEGIGNWRWERKLFQGCFKIWELIQQGKDDPIKEYLLADDYFRQWYSKKITRSMRELAYGHIIGRINAKTGPDAYSAFDSCFLNSCKINSIAGSAQRIVRGVSYRLERSQGSMDLICRPKIVADRLISAIWLQFSELVAGSRTIRQCEECREWMDITETARKGAKRMHERCSLNRRMRKWRQKAES